MNLKSLKALTPRYLADVLRNRAQYLPVYVCAPEKAFKPLSVYLSVNSICNAHCVMCDVGTKNAESHFFRNLVGPDQDLPFDVVVRFLSEVSTFKPKIFVSATEPLIYKQLYELIDQIKSLGMFASVTTNAILLRKHAARLVDSRLDELLVSLDGIGEVNNRIRGKGVFEKAVDGIREVDRIRQERGRETPHIRLNYVISNLNQDNLYEFYEVFDELGVIDSISFSHLNFVTIEMAQKHNLEFGHIGLATPESLLAVDPVQIKANVLWEQIAKIKSSRRNTLVFFNPELKSVAEVEGFYQHPETHYGQSMCRLPWGTLSVMADGTATLSARCFDVKLGSIVNDSFEDIWHGPKMQELRRSLYEHKKFPVCSRCCGVLS